MPVITERTHHSTTGQTETDSKADTGHRQARTQQTQTRPDRSDRQDRQRTGIAWCRIV